jgi:predicted ATP-dependent Lon-type protease
MALNARAAQEFVPIKEVRDGIIVLKDGGLRAVLIASSINLSLKSEEEQHATIVQFQTFLNGLDFPVEISVQSRKLDIRPYILSLEERMRMQTEPLIKLQTKEYMDFIRSFTEEVNIMTKSFFVVVPYSGDSSFIPKKGFLAGIFGGGKEKVATKEEDEKMRFEEKRTQLDERVGVVVEGLGSFGVRSTQLGTEEVIELFYKTFNPGDISQGVKLS